MNCPNSSTRHCLIDEPLWLLIQLNGRSHCFEFPPNVHKAIVIGSSASADVKIPTAAAVAFFLERVGEAIWLMPTNPDTVRIDTTTIDGKRRILNGSIIETANVELRIKIRDTPPTLRGDGRDASRSVAFSPTFDQLTSTTEIDASTLLSALQLGKTVQVPPVNGVYDEVSVTKTVEIEPFNFDDWFDANVIDAGAKIDSKPPKPDLYRTIEIAPVGRPIRSETTDFELPTLHQRLEAVAPNTRDDSHDQPSSNTENWFQSNDTTRPVNSPPVPTRVRKRQLLTTSLEQLGILAKKRPLLVFGGTIAGAFVFVMFLAGITRILVPNAGHQPRRVVTRTVEKPQITVPQAIASSNPTTPIAAPTEAAAPSSATASTEDIVPAVGHLFAGRLPEAEQAYRELSRKFPNEPAFQSLTRVLARKNGTNCRLANSSKAACPSVKP
jgi:hypothetical protein